ncbi:DUF952 domain-containing protein [Novosphingobium sp. M1R2S20]|uniref:DUF952 domain-containing protein n=1 Tax=Novosphingobium rhizovicinum TaxID=3228928 RepID=A0ABV3RDK2_9SPHN
MSQPITVAYKVLTAEQMAQFEREGVFTGAPVDLEDGYIHLSTGEQLEETVAKHFAGQENLQLAEVDLIALGESVRWEPSRGGALFPHIYGTLPLAAVIAYGELKRTEDERIARPVAG